MRFITFQVQNEDKPRVGFLTQRGNFAADINTAGLDTAFSCMIDLIQNLTPAQQEHLNRIANGEKTDSLEIFSRNKIRLRAPILRPIHDILCVGVNYRDHLEETQTHFDSSFQEPQSAVYFSKRAVSIIGPEETIESRIDVDEKLDYEVELAVIIGKEGRDISPERAEKYIFGYSILNDISARGLQKKHAQWFKGKSLDTFTSLGPTIVTREELPFPLVLDVCSRVNGEVRQKSNTRLFLNNIPTLIADLSRGMTLEAGDILSTGTPSGVGMGFTPPKFMKKGDFVECEIEKIGILKNYVD